VTGAADVAVDAVADVAAGTAGAVEDVMDDVIDVVDGAAWQVGQFLAGAGEATWGLLEFAFKVSPIYAVLDPQGFVEHGKGLAQGIVYGVQNPREFAKAVLDWDTWKENPARALGHLVPDLLLTLATAGAGGAARGASAANRLRRTADKVDALGPRVFPAISDADRAATVRAMGFDPATPSGKAASAQLGRPYGSVDDWVDAPLAPGDRVAYGVPGITGFGVKVPPGFSPADARAYYESLQVAPRRMSGDVPPTVRQDVEIYEVRGPVDAAASVAAQNTQWGAGGRAQVYVPDAWDAIDAQDMVKVDSYRFDPSTTRSPLEDPRFTMVDPRLPDTALDPVRQTHVGRVQGAAVGGGVVVGEAVEEQLAGRR
jgi:hypothetical protein